MTEDSLDLTLISAKLMKPVLAEVDSFAAKHGISRNKALNLLLSLGVSYWKELTEQYGKNVEIPYVR
jgi:hypothetical protein